MNQKEKAIDLVEKFEDVRLYHNEAKQCASIAVKIVIKELSIYTDDEDMGVHLELREDMEWWKGVLTEIEKL